MSISEKKKVYTTDNIECIGPCIPPGIVYLHPILLHPIYSETDVSCPTNPYIRSDGILDFVGNCNNEDYENINLTNIVINSTIPSLGMNSKTFLSLIYNIKSFEDTINWINNNNDNVYDTLNRILNCAWDEYMKEIPNIKILFIEFYEGFTKKHWMKYISKKIKQKKIDKMLKNSELSSKIIYNSFRKILYEYSDKKEFDYNGKMKKYVRHYIVKYSK